MNVQTMNIHQQMVIFFGKTMKLYSNTVILSLKIYEKILKSNFVMEGGGGGGGVLNILTVYAFTLKRSVIDVEVSQFYNHTKDTFE